MRTARRDFEELRARMVQRQLAWRGITDQRVLETMGTVPREKFIARSRWRSAYSDRALALACGQTISQPYVVGLMCQALRLRGDEHVLEIGTGSGYTAAILARLATSVVSIERHAELTSAAVDVLSGMGVRNVTVITADGSQGWPDHAPYDAIAVHAMARDPQPFLEDLAPGGRLVIPLAKTFGGELTLFTAGHEGYQRSGLCQVRFVPLVSDT